MQPLYSCESKVFLPTCNKAVSLYRLKLAPADLNSKVMRISDRLWEILRCTSHCIPSCELCGHGYLATQHNLCWKKWKNTCSLQYSKERSVLGQMVHIHVAYAGFWSVKQLGVFLLPLDGMLICWHPLIPMSGERYCVMRGKYPAQEHHALTPCQG